MKKYLSFLLALLFSIGILAGCAPNGNLPGNTDTNQSRWPESTEFPPSDNSHKYYCNATMDSQFLGNYVSATLMPYASEKEYTPEDFHEWEYLANSRTPEAYNKIVKGNADIIFVAQPSGGQKKRAEESGVTLIYTPFAREAFVFIVNVDNPVNSLTEQQVRDIFSGAITNWRTVGGNDQEIQTWQRPEDSGSQTVMQSQVMKNVRMISPQETEVASMMEGMIKVVAEYRNTNNAIGYTFRYYATQMNADKNIKLLAINGIAPTAENIRNGKYPYIVDAFMVTRENMTSETQKLVEWFLTPQGQSLVEDVGYVPMYKTLH